MLKRKTSVSIILAAFFAFAALPARAQLEQAQELYRSGEYERAEELAVKLASGGSQRGAGALLLGRIQLETGRYDEARASAERARRAPALAAAAHELEGEALLKVGRTAEAVRALERAVEEAGDDDGWRARVLLGRAHLRRGNLLAARPVLDGLAEAYNSGSLPGDDPAALTALAVAMAELEYWHDANDMFTKATKLDRTRVETQTEWARLFLEKYDAGHAEECLRDALKANPNHPGAHLLMAKVRMRQGFDFVQAGRELDQALAINPNLTGAYAFRATLDVRDRLWEEAHEELEKALSIDPSDPYALSVKAATYYVADESRDYEKAVAKLRGQNRRFTGHYEVLTDLLEWEHRYEEIVELNREALQINPGYWPAHAAIGINLLRQGEEEEGLRELRASWDQDSFNVLVYNMLNLYEDVLTKEYSFTERGPITYRFHRNDQKVLERYLPELLSRGYREMCKRYGIRPRGTVVEVFATEDHFARRSVGLPRIGVQGVCFGKVVVAGGPRATPVNYGQVLWHELGHVFTIQLSRSRVPRWFTEGLSVHEEGLGSPHWGRDDDAAFYRWIKADRMPPVASLNTAFSRARSRAEFGLAYYGSAQLTEFIKTRYGWPRVIRMLHLYGQGKRTHAVVRQALGVSPDELDREFRQHTLKSLDHYAKNFQVDYDWYYDLEDIEKRVKARPNDAALLGEAAVAALAHRQVQAAQGLASKALKLDPAQPRARHVLCDIAAATGRFDEAREHFAALKAQGLDGYGLRLNLAAGAKKAGDLDAAITHLKRAAALDPQQIEPHAHLAKIYAAAGRDAEALAELRRAADLNQHDAGLYRELLSRLAERDQWDLVRQYGEKSLWNDPFHAPLHLQLARAYSKTGDRREAVFEYESALLCEPEEPAAIHVELGRLYLEMGQRTKALAQARRALELDASHAEAQGLVEEITGGRR